MRVFQLVHTLNYGDAISGEALLVQRILAEEGIENDIYSLNAHEKVKKNRKEFSELAEVLRGVEKEKEEYVILLHYSLGSPLNDLFAEFNSGRRLLIYHNLTPEHFYKSYNARVYKDLCVGRSELKELVKIADGIIADSHYNASEIAEIGRPDSAVLPLVLDCDRWNEPANPGILQALSSGGNGPSGEKKNFLHVGRMAPNKCIGDIIRAFYFYYHKINSAGRLWLIGSDIDNEIHSFELRRLVRELLLEEAVTFCGSVSDGELRAFYSGSDAYICMSEHEGFCVPLLEAMRFKLPIIAFDSTAVGETLADAGLLVKSKHPGKIAELMDVVVTNEELRKEIIARGDRRLKVFNEADFRKNLLGLLCDSSIVRSGNARSVR